MPAHLKALVTISVWILFVVGCLGLLLGFILLARRTEAFRLIGLGVFSLMFSVISTWFRKQLG